MSAQDFSTSVAYFSMEFGIDQALKTYSGGLGYLAGSHMRSANALNQNLIGVGILWKYGYYDQTRKADNSHEVMFREHMYSFLEDTTVRFQIEIDRKQVWVAVYLLSS
jgi:glycogen phosphorylase